MCTAARSSGWLVAPKRGGGAGGFKVKGPDHRDLECQGRRRQTLLPLDPGLTDLVLFPYSFIHSFIHSFRKCLRSYSVPGKCSRYCEGQNKVPDIPEFK